MAVPACVERWPSSQVPENRLDCASVDSDRRDFLTMIFRAIVVTLVLMPLSSAPSSVLAAPPAACGGGFVALTFDDGPTPDTSAMLDALKLHNLKATFFLIGRNVAMYPTSRSGSSERGTTSGTTAGIIRI